MSTADLRKHLEHGGVGVFDLTPRTKIWLTGADRLRYLNGQVSNDVRRLNSSTAMQACVMTAKGKMNALIWIRAGADFLQIDAEPGSAEGVMARLERYIISDDVELADVTSEFALAHCIGVSREVLAPNLPPEVTLTNSNRFGMPGVDLLWSAGFTWGAQGVNPQALESSGINSVLVNAETAEVFRIEQGIPVWGKELDENTIPVEAGLEGGSIDYHKGCYIGQEVISRIKSVGHVNRHLAGFLTPEEVPPGTRIFSEAKDVGFITSSAWSSALNQAVALGYLKRGFESAPLAVPALDSSANLTPIQRKTLPLFP
jgi:folate-binding protein YgfZ